MTYTSEIGQVLLNDLDRDEQWRPFAEFYGLSVARGRFSQAAPDMGDAASALWGLLLQAFPAFPNYSDPVKTEDAEKEATGSRCKQEPQGAVTPPPRNVRCKLELQEDSTPPRRHRKDRSRTPVRPKTPKAIKTEPGVVKQPSLLIQTLSGSALARPMQKAMLDYVQVLRSCVSVATLHHGESWPAHLAIVDAGNTETLRDQMSAHLVAAVLYSRDHWSLLAVRRNQDVVLYDGLPAAGLQGHAGALLLHLQEVGWWDGKASPKLRVATVPKQPDTWSCGHQVALTLDFVIHAVEADGKLPTNRSLKTGAWICC